MNSTFPLYSWLIIRLAEHAKCVVSQLLHMKQAKISFEKVSQVVEKLSLRVGKSFRRDFCLHTSYSL
jgi:hypothetical protein